MTSIKINTIVLSTILGSSIILSSLTGCTINKSEIEKVSYLPSVIVDTEKEITTTIKITEDNNEVEVFGSDEKRDLISTASIIDFTKEENLTINKDENEVVSPVVEASTAIANEVTLPATEIDNAIENEVTPPTDEANITVENIVKYSLNDYLNIIMQNKALFDQMCSVVESKENLPEYAKREVISTFPRLIQAKKYIDFDDYFEWLTLLDYEEDYKIEFENKGLGSFGIADGIPTIVLYSEFNEAEIFHHEFEHFNGAKIEKNNLQIAFSNDRFQATLGPTGDEEIILTSNYNYFGDIFEEGIVSNFTRDNGYPNHQNYPDARAIVDAYTYLLGTDKILESHHSNDKVAVLMNSILNLGFTPDEVAMIFTRLDELHFRTSEVPTLNASLPNAIELNEDNAIKVEFLKLQAADDLIKIYEKIKQSSFKDDALFCSLLDVILNIPNRLSVLPEISEIGFPLYSEDLYNMIISKTPLTNFNLNIEGESRYKIMSTEVRLNAFNPLNTQSEVSVRYVDNTLNDLTSNTAVYHHQNGQLILVDINQEDISTDFNITEEIQTGLLK